MTKEFANSTGRDSAEFSIYLTKKKPPVSVHVDEREKSIFYSFWSLFVPNFIILLVWVHFPIIGIVGTRVKKFI